MAKSNSPSVSQFPLEYSYEVNNETFIVDVSQSPKLRIIRKSTSATDQDKVYNGRIALYSRQTEWHVGSLENLVNQVFAAIVSKKARITTENDYVLLTVDLKGDRRICNKTIEHTIQFMLPNIIDRVLAAS